MIHDVNRRKSELNFETNLTGRQLRLGRRERPPEATRAEQSVDARRARAWKIMLIVMLIRNSELESDSEIEDFPTRRPMIRAYILPAHEN